MKHRTTPHLLAALLAPFLLLATSAWAQNPDTPAGQEDPPVVELESPQEGEISDAELDAAVRDAQVVVVTATRTETDLYELPFGGAVVTRREAARRRTVQDAIRDVPGVRLQRTSYGQTSPFLRGLTGYHTVLLMDGIRLNDSTWRSGPNEYFGLVDGLAAQRLEVVFGPASVLYGSDAVGGALNVIPRRVKATGESFWERRAVFRYAGAEDSLTGRAEISGGIGGLLGFTIGGTLASFDDLKAGGDIDTQPHTGYGSDFQDVALDFTLSENWSLGLLAQRARLRKVRRTHRTIFGVSFHGTTIGSDQRRNFDFDRDLIAVTLDGLDLDGFFDEVKVRLSYQRKQEAQDRIRGSGARRKLVTDIDTFGVVATVAKDTVIGRITAGVDWYHDEVDSSRKDFAADGTLSSVSIQGSVGDDSSYDLVGVFIQDEIAIGDRVDLILGGRFTFAALDSDSVQDPVTGNEIGLDDDWTSLVGSARVLWRAVDELHLWGGVSQGFRAPNLSDVTRLDSARTNEVEIPSPDLDPEDFITFEVGAKSRWGGFSGSVTYSYTIIDDLIIRQPTGMMIDGDFAVAKRNAGDGHVQTIEAALRYDFCDNWSAFGTFAWTDGQVDTFPTSAPVERTEPLSRLSPIEGTVGIQWQTDDGKFWVRPWVRIVDAQNRLSTRDRSDTSRIPPGGTPGYTIWNFDAGYRFNERAEAFLSIENISDKNYRTHGSGVQEPGINVVIGADVTF